MAEADIVAAPTARTRSIAELPKPRGLPLLGNALQLNPKKLHLTIERWALRYGAAYTFRLFGRRVLVLSDPGTMHTALRERPATFRRMATIHEVLKDLDVDGVFSAEGEPWRLQRRVVATALDAKHVRTFFPALRDITVRLKRRWERAAAAGAPLDVLADLSRFTVDATTNFAFGYDVNSLEVDDDVIQSHLARIFPMINRRLNLPFAYWRYFKLPIDRALDHSIISLRRLVGAMIDAARERLTLASSGERPPKNFLEAVLSEPADGRAALSADELYGNALTILAAGEDTTASTLAWSLHLIAEHPGVQSRLQAEADAVLGPHAVLANFEDARGLVYHEAVISETLRLKPVVPLFFLEANAATELGGIRVPAGAKIFLATRVQDLMLSAGDSDFVPERWLEEREGGRRFDFAFGAGPRLCPGRNLAMLEMKVALSMIAKNFAVAPVAVQKAAERVREEYSFVMVPRNLRLRLNERERPNRAADALRNETKSVVAE